MLEVDVEYPKNLPDLHNDLSFLPEKFINTASCIVIYHFYQRV